MGTRRRRALATTTAIGGAASLALLSTPAALAATAPLPAGGTVTVNLTSPTAGQQLAYGDDVLLAGTARADGTAVPTHDTVLIYTLDVSGSTSSLVAGGATACGNPDGRGGTGTTLDCEIASLVNLNGDAATDQAIGDVGAVALGGSPNQLAGTVNDAVIGDVSPASGSQPLTGPAAGPADSSQDRDVVTVLKSADNDQTSTAIAGFHLFTAVAATGANTDYEAAVLKTVSAASTSTRSNRLAVLVSDGDATVGVNGLTGTTNGGRFPSEAAFQQWVHDNAAGTRFITFAVGGAASCAGNVPSNRVLGTLQAIASATGGSCTRITDPATLPDVLPQVVQTTLQGVDATVDGSTVGVTSSATFPVAAGTDVPFSTTVSGLAPGDHELCGRATGHDSAGSATVTDCRHVDVVGVTLPPSYGGGTSDVEGSPVAISATANGGSTFSGWQATPVTADPGASCAFADPSAASTTVTCTDDGTYTLTASTTGPADSRTSTLTLGNADPVVSTPTFDHSSPVFVGSAVQVSAPFTDPGTNDSHTCTVSVAGADLTGSVTEPAGTDPGLCTATTTLGTAGSYPATVTVTDDDTGTGSATTATGAALQVVDLTIDGGNASGGGFTGVEGSPVHPTVSVPSGTSLAWSSTTDSADPLTTCSLTGETTAAPAVVCDDDAQLTLTVTATLNGSSRTATVPVAFANAAPVLSIPSFDTAGPVFPGTTVTVSAPFTDAGSNDTFTCRATWNDGTTTPGQVVDHTCSAQRALPESLTPYSASLTVTDDNSGSDTRSTTEGTGGTLTVTSVTVDAPAGGAYSSTEGTPLDVHATGPAGASWSWSVDTTGADAGTACSLANATTAAPTVTCNDDGSFTLRATASLGGRSQSATAPLQVANAAPRITAASVSPSLVAVGSSVTLTAAYTDAGTNDTHTCTVNWGDGTPLQPGTAAGGTCRATRTAAAVGVSNPTVTVTDDDAGYDTAGTDYLVVYDPSGGFVTGGGTIAVAPGSLSTDTNASGKASFGFTSKYQKGASRPSGETQFTFQAGALSFHAPDADWLVISGSKAQYRGTGTVNGQPGYAFQVTAIDGGSTGDRFRIKIWDPSGAVLFDNQRGTSDDFAASTGGALTGGSIVIHASK